MTEVGQKANSSGGGMHEKPHGILGIVRHGKRLDGAIADLERGSSFEEPALESHAEGVFDGVFGEAIAVDWNAEAGAKDGEALDMIGVLVGDQDALKPFRVPLDARQAQADLPRAEPGIDQDPSIPGF